MNIYVDADVIAQWEKGQFDLPQWMEDNHPDDVLAFPPTVLQQLLFGRFAWEAARAQKRARFLELIDLPVSTFGSEHATRAAELAAELKLSTIGFADFQIAACALVDEASLLTFNVRHFSRVPGLHVITPNQKTR